jgi:hypothetical protein
LPRLSREEVRTMLSMSSAGLSIGWLPDIHR